MCRRDKAAGEGDIAYLRLAAQQQASRSGQAQFQVILARCALQVFVKQTLQLTHRHLVQARQVFKADRLFKVGFHDGYHLAELGLGGPQLLAQRHPLLLLRSPRPVTQQQFGSMGRDFPATRLASDQLQGHVHRRHAARAGVAVAIQFK